MEKLLTPYEGEEPYVFVSYSHQDSDKVFKILKKLQDEGLRIWYDEGIECGSEWPDYIAEHILNCKCFMAFHSENSKASRNCKQEIYFAGDNNKDILSIYLEEVKLGHGLKMRLAPFQATYFYKYADNQIDDFYLMLLNSKILQPCCQKPEIVSEERIVPIVFILDTSDSMCGKPIENLSNAINAMIESLKSYSNNTNWKSLSGKKIIYVTYKIAIITFGTDAKIFMNYTDVKDIKNLLDINSGIWQETREKIVSGLIESGFFGSLVETFKRKASSECKVLGAALKVAKKIIDDPKITLESWQNPKLILVTDGCPTDNYLNALYDFTTNGNSAYSTRYAIGIGDAVDRKILKIFAVNPILTQTDLEFESAFQKITKKITGVVYL